VFGVAEVERFPVRADVAYRLGDVQVDHAVSVADQPLGDAEADAHARTGDDDGLAGHREAPDPAPAAPASMLRQLATPVRAPVM